jgi:putative transposase
MRENGILSKIKVNMILDLYSRKLIGWPMDSKMKKELVVNDVNNAYLKRKPKKGIIFHSDRGSQYDSTIYEK